MLWGDRRAEAETLSETQTVRAIGREGVGRIEEHCREVD